MVISSVADWWSNTSVGGVALSAIGPRPGTSAYASDRNIKYDELHVAVVDSTGAISGTAGTVIERLTYLSKLSDGRGTENQATYYKTAINEGSEYIYTVLPLLVLGLLLLLTLAMPGVKHLPMLAWMFTLAWSSLTSLLVLTIMLTLLVKSMLLMKYSARLKKLK